MTDKQLYTLSRRKVLAGLGAVGLTSAGAGLGTSAYFNDTEAFENNSLTAGELDLKLDYRATYAGGAGRLADVREAYPDATVLEDGTYLLGQAPAELPTGAETWEDAMANGLITCDTPGLVNGTELPVFTLDDVKPGDSGEVTTSLHVCGNPTYLRMKACLTADEENGRPDPETDVPDLDPRGGELDTLVSTRIWYDADCDNVYDEGERVIYEGPLSGINAALCEGQVLSSGTTSDTGGDGDACIELGKLEDLVGTTFETIEHADGDSQTVSDTDDQYTITAADGSDVTLELSNFQYEDGDVVGVDVTVVTDGYGLCQVAVKAGTKTEDYVFSDCRDTATVYSPVSGSTGRVRQEISHISFWVCATGDGGTETYCFDPGTYCIGFEWTLPAVVGNEVQTDSLSFDLTFEAEQCRHNSTPFRA